MRLLLDSQTIIWSVDQQELLAPSALAAIGEPTNALLISAATIWEIAIKVSLGKLALSLPFLTWIRSALADLDLIVLPITVEYADRQASLPHHHRDPFDRLIIAQALVENVSIVSADAQLDVYGVHRIW